MAFSLPIQNVEIRFSIEFASEKARQELLAFPCSTRSRAFALLDRMRIDGPNLGMPHTRALRDGLFEIRAKGRDGIGRVIYCMKIGREIVVLHCFVKKTSKTPIKEIQIALKRLKEITND
ncbi:MAG: type II toxin-antitoxin system RelE/ParE family toxin [Sutterella sp.]|jgi:hypothetical protein|nr:type II toxin-antitoxin system RelE/ParE family toxin [Sutterella sp.]MDY3273515.1 type II toxin-antitoxin system RelE/ParE family toxin [Duodenibacillus sp.]